MKTLTKNQAIVTNHPKDDYKKITYITSPGYDRIRFVLPCSWAFSQILSKTRVISQHPLTTLWAKAAVSAEFTRNYPEKGEQIWVPHALWSLAGFGWVFWIIFCSSLERQAFEGGFGPVQHFVNTTIMPPFPAKVGIPISYLLCLGWHIVDFFLPCCLSFLTGSLEVFTPISCFHLAPWCPPSPHTQKWLLLFWEPILLCVRKGKLGLGAGETWQGKRVGRGNRRAGSETSDDELVENFGGWVVSKDQTAFDCITYTQIMSCSTYRQEFSSLFPLSMNYARACIAPIVVTSSTTCVPIWKMLMIGGYIPATPSWLLQLYRLWRSPLTGQYLMHGVHVSIIRSKDQLIRPVKEPGREKSATARARSLKCSPKTGADVAVDFGGVLLITWE